MRLATGVICATNALRPFLSSDQEVTMERDKDKKLMEAVKTQAQTDCARLIRVAESHPICQHVMDRLVFRRSLPFDLALQFRVVHGAKCKVHALPQVHDETRKVIEVIENDFTSQSKVAIADKMFMCALARCDASKRRQSSLSCPRLCKGTRRCTTLRRS